MPGMHLHPWYLKSPFSRNWSGKNKATAFVAESGRLFRGLQPPQSPTQMDQSVTSIVRGLTCSAFGMVSVKIPCSIFADILPVSMEGSNSKTLR